MTTKAQLVWLVAVAACHAVLQNIYSKYQTLLAGLTVVNAAVQQLTAAQNHYILTLHVQVDLVLQNISFRLHPHERAFLS